MSFNNLFDPRHRFGFGINLDDPWRYVGVEPPKSIIIPHLLSLSLPEGRVLEDVDAKTVEEDGDSVQRTAGEIAGLALVERMADARLDFARCWFPWNYFESKAFPENQLDGLLDQGYEKWPFDHLVETIIDRGFGLIPVLACGYQRMLPEGVSPDSNKDEYVKRAIVHARILVRHYKDKINCWQIENEPNWWTEHYEGGWRSGLTWVESGGFKEELLDSLNRAVHMEDPGAVTMINLEADAKKVEIEQYEKYCDMIGLDYYPNYKISSPVETVPFRSMMQKIEGGSKPRLIIETGYPSGPFLLGYTQSKQAEYVRNASMEAYSMDGLNGLGIWRYTDTSWRSFPDQENHFGLFDSRGNAKPAWTVLLETIRNLKG